MNYSKENLQVGDILQYKPLPFKFTYGVMYNLNVILAWIICLFSFSTYAHTSMVTEVCGEDVYITEALMDTGVTKKLLNDKWLPRIVALRVKYYKASNVILAAKWWESKVGCKYDTVACALAGIRGVFRFFRKKPLVFDTTGKFFCSNGVACAYAFSGIQISRAHPSQCEPADINRPKMFCDWVDLKC